MPILAEMVWRWYNDGMEQQEPTKKTTVYLPAAVYERVQMAAKKQRRSFNSELVWLLEQALDREDGQKGQPDAPR